MIVASLWILASPAMVLSVPSIRSTFEQSYSVLMHRETGLGCISYFEWSDRVAVSWLAAFVVVGVIGVFSGLALFRRGSVRSHFA